MPLAAWERLSTLSVLPAAFRAALQQRCQSRRTRSADPLSESLATRLPVVISRSRIITCACGLPASHPAWWMAANHEARPCVICSQKRRVRLIRPGVSSSRGRAMMILSITRAFFRSADSCALIHDRAAWRSDGIRAARMIGSAPGRVMYRICAPAVPAACVLRPTLDIFRL